MAHTEYRWSDTSCMRPDGCRTNKITDQVQRKQNRRCSSV